MKMHRRMFFGVLALAACLLLPFAANEAQSQQPARTAAAPRIDGFDVEPVTQALPGRELVFLLYGSPGGTAAVSIEGATGPLVLVETEAGVYEGTYTIRTRDKITAASKATANLRLGNRVASGVLDERLVGRPSARPPAKAASVAAPRIDRFEVDPPARLVSGQQLFLTMSGTPGGTASARIVGVRGKLLMDEAKAGTYEGAYTIKDRDRIAADARVTGNLRVGDRDASAVLERSLVAGSGYQSSARQAAPVCANCGIVEAVNLIEVKGDGSYVGKVVGGLAGVLLGSQVGSGRGTTVAQVAGAVGGAIAGNEVEKRMKTTTHYEVVVRLENGGSQTLSYPALPAFAVGAKVKVENGTLVAI